MQQLNDTGYEAKVIADSINPMNDVRITTLQLRYPRYIHAELMTHRVFSRNASSSRAIPVKKVLSQVWNEPVIPARFGANIPGMQAGEELSGFKKSVAKFLWKTAGKAACIFAWGMMKVGLHKQWANRVLEPWQFISVVLTSTEWDNWDELRIHPDAQPEIQILARKMKYARDLSTPRKTNTHLPYITEHEFSTIKRDLLLKASVARCARVSYLTHDGKKSSIEEDVKLYDRLVGSVPIHASPTEHQAFAQRSKSFIKNFRGWKQLRCDIEKYFNK